jgi:hypothetical protein
MAGSIFKVMVDMASMRSIEGKMQSYAYKSWTLIYLDSDSKCG